MRQMAADYAVDMFEPRMYSDTITLLLRKGGRKQTVKEIGQADTPIPCIHLSRGGTV